MISQQKKQNPVNVNWMIFLLFEKNIIIEWNHLAYLSQELVQTMAQHNLKNVNNCFDTNIYSYLKTSGGQSSNLYLNVVHFYNTSVN